MISLGIDIGSYSIKVARVDGDAKSHRVTSLDEYPLPMDPAKDKTLDVIEALRDIKSRHPGDDVHIVISAEQNHLSTRLRHFPFRERHKILKSLAFDLEDDIPLSLENAVFEARLCSYVQNGAKVLAMACPKTHIENQLQRFEDANLDPSILSAEGPAACNLFEKWWESPRSQETSKDADADDDEIDKDSAIHPRADARVLINIGHKKMVCSVFQQNQAIDHFTVDWGGHDLTHAISLKYSLHYVEALKELQKKAFILTSAEGATKDQVVLSDALKAEVDRMAQQLRLSLAKAETEHHIKVNEVILCGGGAQLRNLGPYLTQRLEVAVNRLSHIDAYENLEFGSNPNNEMAHLVSIGLALEGLRRPKNPAINFLKGEYARQNASLQKFWHMWGPSLSAMAAFFVIVTAWAFFRGGFSSDLIDTADENLKGHAKKIMNENRPSTRKIQAYIRDQKRKIQQIEVFESLQGINSALDIVANISKLAPPKNLGDINITRFQVKNSEIHIEGYADRTHLISQFQKSLISFSANGKVDVNASSQPVPTGQKGFSFKLQVQRREREG